jgi:CRISPR/Cas system Type II protein with McrA/HNH and RuvC-like nuclease domain
MDARDIGIGQGLVLPAAQARTHRALVLGKRGRATATRAGDGRHERRPFFGTIDFDFGSITGHIRTLSDFRTRIVKRRLRLAFAAWRTRPLRFRRWNQHIFRGLAGAGHVAHADGAAE